MFHSIAQQRLMAVVYVVIVVKNSLETLFQLAAETFADSVPSEIYANLITYNDLGSLIIIIDIGRSCLCNTYSFV